MPDRGTVRYAAGGVAGCKGGQDRPYQVDGEIRGRIGVKGALQAEEGDRIEDSLQREKEKQAIDKGEDASCGRAHPCHTYRASPLGRCEKAALGARLFRELTSSLVAVVVRLVRAFDW